MDTLKVCRKVNRMRNARIGTKLWIVLFFLVALSPVHGYSTTIEQVLTNSWSTENNAAGWNYQGFTLFDNSLGTLNSVSIFISTTLSSEASGEVIKVRSNFYWSAAPIKWLFWTQGMFSSFNTVIENSYSINKDGVITRILPGENTFLNPINNWIGNDNLIPAFYQDSDGPAHIFSSTTRLVYDYTTVPEPTTIFLLGLGLMGLAGIRRKMEGKK